VIALAASIVLALYVIIPGLLFRSISQLFVPLRIVSGSRTEEATRAVLTSVLPFFVALLVVWYVPFANQFPFHASYPELRASDYKLVASCLYSEQEFTRSGQAFWAALNRTWHRQFLFLFWYYLLTVATGLCLAYLAGSYGRLKTNRFYSWFADKFLFPRISEWHPLLTPFIFADKQTAVRADILTTTDNLYRGTVSEHFIDSSGKLTGLILTDALRFDRRGYIQAANIDNPPKPDDFWREIPGAKLYMFADKIVNLNLNYESAEPSMEVLLRFLAKHLDKSVQISYVKREKSG
jgi:hypothetical protein